MQEKGATRRDSQEGARSEGKEGEQCSYGGRGEGILRTKGFEWIQIAYGAVKPH